MSEIEMNPYGMVFTGLGVSAELAIFAAKNSHGLHDVLLKVSGAPAFAAGLDKKVLRYSTIPAGNGQNFDFIKSGKSATRMSTRTAWGSWQYFDLYLDGKTIAMTYDKALSAEAQPLHLLTAYTQALADAPSRLNSERELTSQRENIKELGWNGEIILNWGGLEQSMEARSVAAGAIAALTPVFAGLLKDNLGKEALTSVKKFEIDIIDNSAIEMTKTGAGLNLRLGTGAGADGISDTLTELLQINL